MKKAKNNLNGVKCSKINISMDNDEHKRNNQNTIPKSKHPFCIFQ